MERALATARRNWLLLLVCVLVVPAAALAYSLAQTPEYTASASLLFTDDVADAEPERIAATNLELVSLEQVAARTADALETPNLTPSEIGDKVEVNPAGQSDVINVSVTDPDPETAARLANAFANQVIVFRRNANQAKILRAQAFVQAQIDRLPPDARDGAEGLALAERERQLAVRAAVETGDAQIVQPAIVPDSPSSPNTTRNVALGLLLGIALGISLALLREQFDRRLKDVDEVAQAFRLPILATVPQGQGIVPSDIDAEQSGEEREAFRMLRATLQYFNVEQEVNSIFVTSPAAQDGKTAVSWNLALAEVRAGKRVLYIEADLRRPSLSAQLGMELEEVGLSLVLAGVLGQEAAIRQVQGVDLLCAGPLPPNPAELIDSQRMEQLLEWAEAKYDRVIIDTPPAAVVADAVPLIPQVDGIIVVVRLRHSPREATEHLREQLANTEAPVIGVVINGAPGHPDDNYYRASSDGSSFAKAYDKLSSSRAEGSRQAAAKASPKVSGAT